MANPHFRFTVELLQQYSVAALTNAGELLVEAALLQSNGHAARAYFLAVASIEETGKAVQAFDAQGRNLADSAVTTKLRRAMEDHSQKITSALTTMWLASSDMRNALMPTVDLMIHLKQGREPSMYTDIRYEEFKVQLPSVVVRDAAARDCVRLAGECLIHARKHVAEKTPTVRSKAEDEMFSMKGEQVQQMLNTEGFWWFYISRCEAGDQDFSAAVVSYRRDYVAKGKAFERQIGG